MFETDWAIDIQMPFRCLGANEPYLVGGLEHVFLFFHILGIIIPTDSYIFFSEGWVYHQPDYY